MATPLFGTYSARPTAQLDTSAGLQALGQDRTTLANLAADSPERMANAAMDTAKSVSDLRTAATQRTLGELAAREKANEIYRVEKTRAAQIEADIAKLNAATDMSEEQRAQVAERIRQGVPYADARATVSGLGAKAAKGDLDVDRASRERANLDTEYEAKRAEFERAKAESELGAGLATGRKSNINDIVLGEAAQAQAGEAANIHTLEAYRSPTMQDAAARGILAPAAQSLFTPGGVSFTDVGSSIGDVGRAGLFSAAALSKGAVAKEAVLSPEQQSTVSAVPRSAIDKASSILNAYGSAGSAADADSLAALFARFDDPDMQQLRGQLFTPAEIKQLNPDNAPWAKLALSAPERREAVVGAMRRKLNEVSGHHAANVFNTAERAIPTMERFKLTAAIPQARELFAQNSGTVPPEYRPDLAEAYASIMKAAHSSAFDGKRFGAPTREELDVAARRYLGSLPPEKVARYITVDAKGNKVLSPLGQAIRGIGASGR